MQQWEYQTLLVRQNNEKFVGVTQINGKEADFETSGGLIKSRIWKYDLVSYLAKCGRDGWEVVGLSPLTSFGAGSSVNEGAINVLVILKRLVE